VKIRRYRVRLAKATTPISDTGSTRPSRLATPRTPCAIAVTRISSANASVLQANAGCHGLSCPWMDIPTVITVRSTTATSSATIAQPDQNQEPERIRNAR
jgi:hypothetical protein